jgi:dTDP-4-dehydrorhamnose 3,5-epimerase
MSFNTRRGTTRGIHAEPWDKLVSSAQGSYFGAWVDLRHGPGFGRVFTTVVDESVAVYVPRGVGNAYQTLADHVTYSYLVDDHWSPDKIPAYAYLNLADPTVAIDWPIPLDAAEISDKDRHHPTLDQVKPVEPRQILILGCRGQLGRALTALYPDALGRDIDDLDLTDPAQVAAFPWQDVGTVLNAAAWTNVDGAETDQGRRSAWQANATVPATLARLAIEHQFTVVHLSTDYVFDGSRPGWTETDPVAPLSVYGQSKAAGDLAIALAPRHYLVRTSWVVGDGRNFVRTMGELADAGVCPQVVGDQTGRLTHTTNLAAAIKHLLDTGAPFGTYNCTDAGPEVSWADIARAVFTAHGRSAADVIEVTTDQFYAGKAFIAPRPHHSLLDLSKLQATGYQVPTYPPGTP